MKLVKEFSGHIRSRVIQSLGGMNPTINTQKYIQDDKSRSANLVFSQCHKEMKEKNMDLDSVLPKKRKAILVLSPADRERLEYSTEGNDLLLNKNIYLLVPTDEIGGSLENSLEISGLLEIGSLLVQNPYETSVYAPLDKALSTFALAKYLHFTTLCGLLGAREVDVEQVEVRTSKGKQIFKVYNSSLYADGGIAGENRTFEEIRNNIKIKSRFDGGKPNIEKAEEHLLQYQLLHDVSMKSLIDQRKGDNPIRSRELILSLSEESKRTFKAIADVNVPTYADIQAQLDQVKKEVYELTLTVRVEF